MIESDITTAIRARLAADATLLGLLNGGTSAAILAGVGLPRTDLQMPYLNIDVDAATSADGFTLDGLDVVFTVGIFALASAGQPALTTIERRIYGDALSQAGRVPTYGLHRWQPSTIGSSPMAFTPTVVAWTDDAKDDDETHYKRFHRFRFWLTKTS